MWQYCKLEINDAVKHCAENKVPVCNYTTRHQQKEQLFIESKRGMRECGSGMPQIHKQKRKQQWHIPKDTNEWSIVDQLQ